MNFDKIIFVIVLFSVTWFLSFIIPFLAKAVIMENPDTKNIVKFFISFLTIAIICGAAISYPLNVSMNNTLQSPTKYVGAEIVARGTDGAYIFEEMEYGTGETYRYISTNWLPYDAVYLLTVDKETDEVLIVWKTVDNGPRIEAVG